MKRNGKTGRFFGVAMIAAVMAASMAGCRSKSDDTGNFTVTEKTLIREAAAVAGNDNEVPAGTMRVLTICDSADLAVLRSPSSDLSAHALLSEEYRQLCSLMVATVTHPSQDGVGIAGPQVGIGRRVVAVQRFDKPGEPFEIYPNIRLLWASDTLMAGPEGCLSVPDRRGDVLRSCEIVVEYADLDSLVRLAAGMTPREFRRQFRRGSASDGGGGFRMDSVPMVRDTVCGFIAVIFQHEIDHLDGILYIDRL